MVATVLAVRFGTGTRLLGLGQQADRVAFAQGNLSGFSILERTRNAPRNCLGQIVKDPHYPIDNVYPYRLSTWKHAVNEKD
jgi:hypothetical protein